MKRRLERAHDQSELLLVLGLLQQARDLAPQRLAVEPLLLEHEHLPGLYFERFAQPEKRIEGGILSDPHCRLLLALRDRRWAGGLI